MNIKESLKEMFNDESHLMELFYVISVDKTNKTLEGIQITSEIDISQFNDSVVQVNGVDSLQFLNDIRLKYKDYIVKDISYSLDGNYNIFTPTIKSTVLCSKLLDGRYVLIVTSNTSTIELTGFNKDSGKDNNSNVNPNVAITENVTAAMDTKSITYQSYNIEQSKLSNAIRVVTDEYDIDFDSKLKGLKSIQGSAIVLDADVQILASPTGKVRIFRNVPTTFVNEKKINVSKINNSDVEGEKGNSEAYNFLDVLYKTIAYHTYNNKNVSKVRDLLDNPDTISKVNQYGIKDIYDIYNKYILPNGTIKKGSAEQFIIAAKKTLDKLNEFQGKVDLDKLKDNAIYKQFNIFKESIIRNIVRPEMTAARLETYIQGTLYTNESDFPDSIVWSDLYKKLYTYLAPFYPRNTANRPMEDIERTFVRQAVEQYKLSLEKYKNKDNKQELIDSEVKRIKELITVTSTYSLKNIVDKQNKIHTDLTKLNEDVIKDLVTDMTALQSALNGLGVPFASQLVSKQAAYLGTLDSINKTIGDINTGNTLLNETEELLKK